MVALPFCHFEKTSKKPLPKAYPKKLVTIGDHIRKRRLDLKLFQREVAEIMSVDEMSVVGWELNHYQPLVRHLPKIIDFLGYVPEDLFPANSLGHEIKRYRLLHGLTRRQLARRLHIDEGTLGKLEIDKGKRLSETLKRISDFLTPLD